MLLRLNGRTPWQNADSSELDQHRRRVIFLLAERASGWRFKADTAKCLALLQGRAATVAKVDQRVKHL